MKLIELPMGQKHEINDIDASHFLRKWPSRFIRAELPEYWRVEGYDKSWEYAQVFCNPDSKNWVGYHHAIGLDVYDNGHPFTADMMVISRAEFEYHIYNHCKKVQDGMNELQRGIEKSRLNQQLDMSDIDTLKQQAEKMGYELVRKEAEWVGDNFNFDLSKESLVITSLPTSFRSDIKITLTQHELETLIEKYNQFKTDHP